ncbi:MAG: hypothetical protein ACKOWG_13980, partial [Planctomycetia bacterium]
MTLDEIHRLVDRKRLFPLRDGTTLKFKIDELDRLAAAGIEDDAPSGLSLELELADEEPAPAAGTFNIELDKVQPPAPAVAPAQADDIALADNIAMPGGSVATGTQVQADSLVLGGSGSLAGDLQIDLKEKGESGAGPTIFADDAPGQDDLAMTMLATGDAIGLDAMELDLDSIVGLSSPAATQQGSAPQTSAAANADDSGTLA